jgi:ABC-type branched-subunit amino acid transport system ATPase component
MLLNVVNVTSGYGRVRIVSGVSLGVDEGEILAIIGRNGVGKTTLMKTLIGGIRLMDGRIEFDRQDIGPLSSAQRARLGIGFVPQGRGIFSRMSVGDNLILGKAIGRVQGEPNFERVYRFFPILKERLQQRAGSMSGGQQQQLAIGRILDEPSEGIQPNIVQRIAEIIRRLRDEGLTVIIVEQNLTLIQAVADRCIVMDKGKVVAQIGSDQIANPSVAKRYLAI